MNIQDLQKRAEEIINSYCNEYNLQPVNIKVKNLKTSGRVRYKTRFISIPLWAYEGGGIYYFTAYILHELTHLILHDKGVYDGHGKQFRFLETQLLKEHDMVPLQYKKSFYYRLEDINGNLLWVASEKKRKEIGLRSYNLTR